jgi:hypothetical protein
LRNASKKLLENNLRKQLHEVILKIRTCVERHTRRGNASHDRSSKRFSHFSMLPLGGINKNIHMQMYLGTGERSSTGSLL